MGRVKPVKGVFLFIFFAFFNSLPFLLFSSVMVMVMMMVAERVIYLLSRLW